MIYLMEQEGGQSLLEILQTSSSSRLLTLAIPTCLTKACVYVDVIGENVDTLDRDHCRSQGQVVCMPGRFGSCECIRVAIVTRGAQ